MYYDLVACILYLPLHPPPVLTLPPLLPPARNLDLNPRPIFTYPLLRWFINPNPLLSIPYWMFRLFFFLVISCAFLFNFRLLYLLTANNRWRPTKLQWTICILVCSRQFLSWSNSLFCCTKGGGSVGWLINGRVGRFVGWLIKRMLSSWWMDWVTSLKMFSFRPG